jgi:CRP/FNR family cyclic AMP-dependent transcriptional regulator
VIKNSVAPQIEAFFSQFQPFSFKADDIVIQTGEPANFVYYLKAGIVKQSSISPQGQEVILTFYKPGAFFPLIWVVKNTAIPYDFRAVTSCQGWKAPKEVVLAFLKSNVDVSFDLSVRLLSGLEGLGRKLEYALQATANFRVREALLTLAYRFGRTKQAQTTIELTLTHQEIADITGLTRETVTRELKTLREQGVVKIKKQTFVIDNLAELEQSLGVAGSR